MSVEKMVQRSLLTWAAAKIAGDLAQGVGRVFTATGKTAGEIATTFLAIEADAGKRYEALTGRSLAALIGTPSLYEDGVGPERFEYEPAGEDDFDDEVEV